MPSVNRRSPTLGRGSGLAIDWEGRAAGLGGRAEEVMRRTRPAERTVMVEHAGAARRRTNYNQSGMADETIQASLLALFLFDVSDEIRLDEIRRLLNAPQAGRKPVFRQPAPEYVQFASP